MKTSAGRLNTPDRLALATLAFFATTCAATQARPVLLLGAMGTLAAVIVFVALSSDRSRAARITHDFLPIPVIFALFDLAGPVVAGANSIRWDATFASLDARWFGRVAYAWRDVLGRPAWLTDLASLFYVSFYFVPIALAVGLYRRPQRDKFDAFVIAVFSAFIACWIGYFAFPTSGPRIAPTMEVETLGGTFLSQAIRVALRLLERNVLDAFPSGHAAVSLVYLRFGWMHFRRWRLVLVLLEVGLLFSTVYLSLHYVVDLLGGVVFAGATVGALSILRRARLLPLEPEPQPAFVRCASARG